MNDLEARVRCLELAAALCKAANYYDAREVATIATILYDFVNAPIPEEIPVEKVDKPRRGRPPKSADLYS